MKQFLKNKRKKYSNKNKINITKLKKTDKRRKKLIKDIMLGTRKE